MQQESREEGIRVILETKNHLDRQSRNFILVLEITLAIIMLSHSLKIPDLSTHLAEELGSFLITISLGTGIIVYRDLKLRSEKSKVLGYL